MNILIKGMEIPKKCLWCPLQYIGFCQVTKTDVNSDLGKRADDCPLVELPEKHGRLIDADALKEKAWDADTRCGYVQVVDVGDIDDAPTIEPERKKGKWIKKMRITETEKYTSYDPEWYCACCGTKYDSHIARMVNFCYVCGADMRGGQDEQTD